MDTRVREAQKKALSAFSKVAMEFALSGGTALELYYLKHRFSADLDFFSPGFDAAEIDEIVSALSAQFRQKVRLESELILAGRARVRFYTLPVRGTRRPLKIDFVEDTVIVTPTIRRFDRVRVYSVSDIYLQKVVAVTGTRTAEDAVGRQALTGRREARDVFDIYVLSKKIEPLHVFLEGTSRNLQRGMVQWYRTFSRQELKLAVMDLDIYDRSFDAREMILHLEREIKQLIKGVTSE